MWVQDRKQIGEDPGHEIGTGELCFCEGGSFPVATLAWTNMRMHLYRSVLKRREPSRNGKKFHIASLFGCVALASYTRGGPEALISQGGVLKLGHSKGWFPGVKQPRGPRSSRRGGISSLFCVRGTVFFSPPPFLTERDLCAISSRRTGGTTRLWRVCVGFWENASPCWVITLVTLAMGRNITMRL